MKLRRMAEFERENLYFLCLRMSFTKYKGEYKLKSTVNLKELAIATDFDSDEAKQFVNRKTGEIEVVFESTLGKAEKRRTA